MTPLGLFGSQLNTIERVLREVQLLDARERFPKRTLRAADFRGKSYRAVYELSVGAFAFDFKLKDQALLLFLSEGSDCHDGRLSYSYLESPFDVISYQDFLAFQFQLPPTDPAIQELLQSGDASLAAEYEQYLASSPSKTVVTPIRYDYSAAQYRAGLHPVSHMHFGFGNEMRVATRNILNPMSFTLFVVRQRYPESWLRLSSDARNSNLFNQIRQALDRVDNAYWCSDDDREMCLN